MKSLFSSHLLVLLALLFGAVSAEAAADRFYAENANFEPGESKAITFCLDNSQKFFGFQADIKLPDGLEIVNVNGKPDCTLSSRANKSYALVSNQHSDNMIRVGAFSTDHTAFSGNSGALLYVNVKASDSFSGGTMMVSDILFTNADNNDVALPDYVVDLDTKHKDRFYIPDFKIAVGETKDVSIILENETSFTAFQTDIYLPEGLVILANSPIMTSRGSGHSLTAKAFSDGRVRLACISLNNAAFTGNSGELVTMKILATKDAAETCNIEMKNNIFSMSNAKEYLLPNSSTAVTTERALVEQILLSHSSVNMVTGESFQLTANVIPTYASTKDIEWSSSNTDIATVNESGMITALIPGSVVITATAVDGSGVSASCDVEITGVPVTAISLNRSNGKIKVGESLVLAATVQPANAYDKSVTWSSSNDDIVTVDNDGKVTAMLEGSASITATSVSNPEISAACVIEVILTPVSSIELNPTEVSVEVGEKVKIEASVLPLTATDKTLTWRSVDESIATVDTLGNVTGVALGSVSILAEAKDGSGVTSSCMVNVIPTAATGISILAPTSTTFRVGETITLTANVEPANATDRSVVWACSSPEIATVNGDGVVSAIKEGEAVIVATNSAGNSAQITLTVVPTPAESITVTPQSSSLQVGDACDLLATVYPVTTTDKSVTWSSSNSDVATVDAKGHVVAVALGTATVTATANDGSGVKGLCVIEVVPTPATGIKINHSGSTSLHVGDAVNLTATVTPDDATDKSVLWNTQSAKVLQVDAEGNVKAVGLGEAWISATNSAGQIDYITFTVVPTPVTQIRLSHTSAELKAGETMNLTAIVLPEDATDKSVIYTSGAEAVAIVNKQGLVTAISVGDALITAVAADGSGVSASCAIKVVPTPVESITVTAAGSTTLKAGETVQLTATVLPETATDKSVTWSSANSAVAEVDANGLVTAHAVGVVEITATAGGKLASVTVTVEKTLAEGIQLSRQSCVLKVGGRVQPTAIVYPETTTNKTLRWESLSPEVASVDADGKITANELGECDIVISTTDGSDISVVFHVKVEETAAESVSISPKGPFTLRIGESVQFSATVMPETTTDKSVTWLSQTEGVVIDKNGLATAVAPVVDNRISAANSAGQEDYVYITVLPTLVSSISVDKSSVTLKVGESAKLTATVLPDDATDKSVTWTSLDSQTAIVAADGTVTALSLGKTTLRVIANDESNVYAEVDVNVVPTPVESIAISAASSTTIKVGERVQLTAVVLPENATDKTVAWSASNSDIASVDINGLVTANSVGSVEITASSGNQTASIIITVDKTLAQSVVLNKYSAEMKVAEQLRLVANVMPTTTTDKTLSWSSSNTDVVTVDDSGIMTAVELGDAVISAATVDGSDIVVSCNVKVVETPAESVRIDYDGPTTVYVGFADKLAATVYPETTTDKTLTWIGQNDEVIHVESDGEFVATGPGEAWIRVETANGLTDKVNFKVLPILVESILLSTDQEEMCIGESKKILATVLPENATDKTLSWISHDESIATVDQNGVVTGVSIGRTSVYALAADGSNVMKSVSINILPIPVESIDLYANGSTILKDGESVTLTATLTPANATYKSVTWSSDNTSVATVIDGIVTAHGQLGVAHIAATTSNGISAEIEVTVVETPVESISISPGGFVEMLDGENLYLSAYVYPATATYPSIYWSVSDESIISVNDYGTVTALYPGEAYVYAESQNGIKESVLVRVNPILIERIEYTDHFKIPLYAETGGRTQVVLKPRLYPENASIKEVHWTAPNSEVGLIWPTADGGEMFWATGLGSITLTCHTMDGSNLTHTVDVEVINPPTGITLSEHALSLKAGQTIELTAAIEPIDATGYYVYWGSSDSNVATVVEGIVEAIAEGNCTIHVLTSAGLGLSYTDECEVAVSMDSGVQTVSLDNVSIVAVDSKIIVKNVPAGHKAALYDLNGILLSECVSNSEDVVFNVTPGTCYIVSAGKCSLKVNVR